VREPLFVDTSAWFAFVNRSDPEHVRARQAIEAFRGRLLTSNFVFDETVTLCRYRLGHEAAVRVGETLHMPRVVELVRASHEDEQAAWRVFVERSDKRYSFTDCVSFVMMRRLGLGRAAALDDDFRREGFQVVP
jgi:predicted nucleic acid-binding protein